MGQAKRKYKIGVILGVLGLVLLAAAGVVMLLLGTVPGIYQPFVRPGSGEVSPYITHDLAPDFFTGMQEGRPFEMVFRQEGLNELLAFSVGSFPFGEFTLSAPSVVLTPDAFVLMATAQVKNVSSVLTITAKPAIEADGRLNLNITSAKLGAIPVLGIVRGIGRQIADEYLAGAEEQAYAGVVNGVLNNEPFEPLVSFSKYTMRVKALTLEEGKVRLLIEPVKDKDVREVRGPRVP